MVLGRQTPVFLAAGPFHDLAQRLPLCLVEPSSSGVRLHAAARGEARYLWGEKADYDQAMDWKPAVSQYRGGILFLAC
ncbi:hypothetical protein D3C79_697100 [compost metagenome]